MKKASLLSCALLVGSVHCAIAQTPQSEPEANSSEQAPQVQEATTASGQPAEAQAAPATQEAPAPSAPTAPAPAAPGQAGMPPGSIAPAVTPDTPAAPGTAVPPGAGASAGAPVAPGTVPPGAVAPPTGAYVPQTEFDNTPHRFNMTQDGKRMSADDFDAWMRSRGYRVAKGAPPADCPNAPPAGVETIVGPDGCPVEVSIELDGVTFAFAKSTLLPEAKKTLDQAVEILKRHPELTVEVAGHTDSRGAADFNQKLSETRAKAVYDYLIEKGIAATQLEGPIGYGESKPVASNDTDAGREENRRTELNIKAVAALPAPAVAADAPPVVLPETAGAQTAETPQPAAPAPAEPETQPAPEEEKEDDSGTP